MSYADYTLHIVSHSHWDREWYQPFVGYQRRLVFLIDKLLELLESNTDFRAFYLDGQTCMLDDYLAMRPEKESKLRKYLQNGRLGMGPWYVMPDELLVSGEALVRNLEKGVERCAEMECQSVPLLHASDVFGHCSQMPQIMRGFAIDKTMLLRGTSSEDEQSEMVWTGADGTKVWILKVFPDTGYCDVWTHRRETDERKLRHYEERKTALATTPVLIGLDGNDHQAAFAPIGETMERMNEAFQKTKVQHSSMREALEEVDKYLDLKNPGKRKQFQGELRTPAKTGVWNEVFFGTASARIPTKQKNDLAQRLLTRIGEPLHAISALNGGSRDRTFLDKAWEYLLKCHPHDSIVGCSTDQVDKDVHYRLDQAIEIAKDEAGEAIFQLASKYVNQSSDPSVVGHLFLFNPSNSPSNSVIEVEVEVPHDNSIGKPKEPVLKDASGKVLASSLKLQIRNTFPSPIPRRIDSGEYLRYGCRAHETGNVDRWSGVVELSLPSFGFASLQVMKGGSKLLRPTSLEAEPVRLDAEAVLLENAFIALKINPDATFDLKDKVSGREYKKIGQFEYQHDKGNGWDFKPLNPQSNPSSLGHEPKVQSVKIEMVENSELRSSFVVRGKLRIYRGLNANKTKSLRGTVTVSFSHVISLDAGARSVCVKTALDNHACDMRLRLIMPTHLPIENWWSDSPFDLVKRSVKLPDSEGWKERVRPETPFMGMVAVHDEGHGMAVVTKGLQEGCVLDGPDKSIALTLLRCYRQNIGSSETKDSQQQGLFEADWQIGCFNSEKTEPGPQACLMSDQFRMSVQSITLNAKELVAHGGDVQLTLPHISGDLELSAFLFDEKGLLLRFFNPHESARESTVSGLPLGVQVQQVHLNGSAIGNMDISADGKIVVRLKPKEIQTWRVLSSN